MSIRIDEENEAKKEEYLFTSESVSEGHPDKVCDQISDAIVDEYLSKYGESRVAVETLVTTNKIVLAGEVRCPEEVSHERLEEIARGVVEDIGYEQEAFHWQNADIDIYVHEQSADIAQGVDAGEQKDEGAGDQGLMFGYACDETDVFMPAPIHYSHRILKALSDARHSGEVSCLGPDAKSQVTYVYEGGIPKRVDAVLVSTQHEEGVSQEEVREIVRKYVAKSLPDGMMVVTQSHRFLASELAFYLPDQPRVYIYNSDPNVIGTQHDLWENPSGRLGEDALIIVQGDAKTVTEGLAERFESVEPFQRLSYPQLRHNQQNFGLFIGRNLQRWPDINNP